ncbi:DUF3955 domain-containing protein [Candidatus Thiothrix sp. Deng01]|uniref:DUF3955 domain-containing protein n=1 Tax=Candidatus Thiothrix phosphatis TaxID=3112415 RepID=A0ABU6D037_9GAMM|nr:DUF3955 domain-containing protein [Candidatus Thiothrix sp. Deng01]MEB4592450.1 DUF3955 domain-containing protein [Candidatus Thiothrix sp. Deng01]
MCGKFSILFLGLGAFSLVMFSLIRPSVDDAGILHEPFALLPIGYLMLLAAGVTGLLCLFGRWHAVRRSRLEHD